MKQPSLALIRYKALNKWGIKKEDKQSLCYIMSFKKKAGKKYATIEWKHEEKCYFYSDLLENSLKKNNSFAQNV